MSVLIFLGVLFVLVLVHELGHFAVAKWTKMRVDEFGIGFPPKLFGIKGEKPSTPSICFLLEALLKYMEKTV